MSLELKCGLEMFLLCEEGKATHQTTERHYEHHVNARKKRIDAHPHTARFNVNVKLTNRRALTYAKYVRRVTRERPTVSLKSSLLKRVKPKLLNERRTDGRTAAK